MEESKWRREIPPGFVCFCVRPTMYHPPYEYYPQPQYIYGYPPPPPPQYWPPPPPPPEASIPQNAPQAHRYPSPHAIQSPHPQPSSHSSQHSHSSQPSPNVSPVAPRWQEEVQHPPPIDFAKVCAFLFSINGHFVNPNHEYSSLISIV